MTKRNGTYKNPYLLELGKPAPSHVVMDTDPLVLYDILQPGINAAVWVPTYPATVWNYIAKIGQSDSAPPAPWFVKEQENGDFYARLHPAQAAESPYLDMFTQTTAAYERALPRGQGRHGMAQYLGTAATHFALVADSRRLHLTFRSIAQAGNMREQHPHTDGFGLQMFTALNEGGIRFVSEDEGPLKIAPRCRTFSSKVAMHKHLPWAKLQGRIWEVPNGAILFMKGHGFKNPLIHAGPPLAKISLQRPNRTVCFATAARGRFSANPNYKPLGKF